MDSHSLPYCPQSILSVGLSRSYKKLNKRGEELHCCRSLRRRLDLVNLNGIEDADAIALSGNIKRKRVWAHALTSSGDSGFLGKVAIFPSVDKVKQHVSHYAKKCLMTVT